MKPDDVAEALAPYGLVLRGGFDPDANEAADFPAAANGRPAASVLLVGGAGGSYWTAFSAWLETRQGFADPLDVWTKETVAPIADEFGAVAVYPFEPPWQPFQRWAQRAENVYASPLGILIHPDYGLWHAYRAALIFPEPLELDDRKERASPCDACADKPCLSACPVGAFSGSAYDLSACAGHLATPASRDCHLIGCRARDACPVGRDYRYGEAQRRFHMAAFTRARGVEPIIPED
ncbi:MAG: 4Fe-4S dicluster domain-containing protein [Rhodobiaceae bacterium]|nr:4Fe-4S dicluster domain-containing protein [Rhodobiaceae bacterium]MCC0018918.1 4Fe-4S dicluster domain-containing protein [Rhodobiaceae bacterium]MCC0051191.1 4Fe-4S dicluster domain-containing protein [Rhodobiaceae bacterium]MCC0059959.1 4Fe-4S dicluster domain-containing protein [Rhodobiaceae bacterium]